MTASDREVVDVAFDVTGTSLPADNAWLLAQALERRLPWLADEALAGIHPLRAAATGYGVVLLAQRAKLVLRLPEARLEASLALAGAELDIADCRLAVGEGRARALQPSATLAAQRVATAAGDAQAFEDEVRGLLEDLAVACDLISGRPRHGVAGARAIAGFALTLHGVSAADSVRIQGLGIGGDRRLGWGLFVPAKSMAAVRL